MIVTSWQALSFFQPCFFDLNYVFQLEKILTLMSRLPDDFFATKLQQFFIDIREFLLILVTGSFNGGTMWLAYSIIWTCSLMNPYQSTTICPTLQPVICRC